jgi:hypothetical protein
VRRRRPADERRLRVALTLTLSRERSTDVDAVWGELGLRRAGGAFRMKLKSTSAR